MIEHWLKCAPALQYNETHWLLLIVLSHFQQPATVDDVACLMKRTTRHVWNQIDPVIESGFVRRVEGTGISANGRRHRKAHFYLTNKAKALLGLNVEGLA
jgi:predicted transcriptional regulator